MHDNFFKDLAIRLTVTVAVSVTLCVVMDYLKHKDEPKAKKA